ncbi:MAG: potassium channel protein [Coriobacteriia bacterium]|nr:potassium channel protein [Coriobacteriia bacterium]
MFKRLAVAGGALVSVLVIGAVGYVVIERASFFDALYMTVITVGGVGFSETIPLSQSGRAFTMLLILTGFGAVLFALGTFIDFVVEGHLRDFVEGRRMQSGIERLSGHHIIAGIGRVGAAVARVLADEGAPFVIIEHDLDAAAQAKAEGWLVLVADATDEEVLERAGIRRAQSLVTALDADADNLFVTFSARAINPELFIVARSSHESSEAKLRRAGANRVMTPNVIGGRRMATMVLHPAVSDYLDLVTHGDGLEYRLQEIDVHGACAFAGNSIAQARVRDVTGAYILAVQGVDGVINTNPASDTVLCIGDRLVVLGTMAQLEALHVEMQRQS